MNRLKIEARGATPEAALQNARQTATTMLPNSTFELVDVILECENQYSYSSSAIYGGWSLVATFLILKENHA